MAFYLYTTKDGRTVGRKYRIGTAPDEIVLEDGRSAKRDVVEELRSFHSPRAAGWPMKSDALGVHPSQVNEARKESVRLGVPTDFTPDGRAILKDRKHRKKYAEAKGYYDRNGGYGDPQKKL